AGLTRSMQKASKELDFEKAARLRDQIAMLDTVIEQNAVAFASNVDVDVFGVASDELEASVHAFFVRSGAIRGERNWSVERVEDVSDSELISDLLVQVYSDLMNENDSELHKLPGDSDTQVSISQDRDAMGSTQKVTALDAEARAKATRSRHQHQDQTGRADLLAPISPVPPEVIVPIQPDRTGDLQEWLRELRGSAVTIRVASRGEKKSLMDRANANARQA
ncbi:MAG: UvrB/UvrC motif-containing protein, partial [Bifidobacterium sp.]|nr:UvrB/UvrC motif-containing protein [Bifidobacterium sp.]